MDTVREIFAWLAMMSGFANALSFIPQLRRVVRRRQSGDIALSTYVSWLIIMAFGVIHLFLEHDYYYGAGLAASWFTCLATTLTVAYYRTRVAHGQELGA